jgi:hypothetical protein
MAKKFEDLRAKMSPSARARAAKHASEMLKEMPPTSLTDNLGRRRPSAYRSNSRGTVARNIDEVVASLPAVRRFQVERRARELASSTKPSPPTKKKRTAKRRS